MLAQQRIEVLSGFAFGGVVPPLLGFAGLGVVDGGGEGVPDAGVLAGVGEAAEADVEFVGFAFGELGDGGDAELDEVLGHRFADVRDGHEFFAGDVGHEFILARCFGLGGEFDLTRRGAPATWCSGIPTL